MPDEPRDQDWAGRLRAARVELDAAVEGVRQLPGHAAFLGQISFQDVAAVSLTHPLIYLTPTFVSGLALWVRGDQVIPVDLPKLSDTAVSETATELWRTYASWRSDPRGQLAAWRDCLDRTGRWLWDVVIGPVVSALPLADVTLIPCGRLGFLPLHAAWTPADDPSGRCYLLDVATVSYVPSARALRAAQQVRDVVGSARLLAVVEPEPTASSPLPFARSEVDAAVIALDGGLVLERTRASTTVFREVIAKADVFHFAGHGLSDLDEPMDSSLFFADDQTLQLRDIFALPVRLRLAVLSACETAMTGRGLPDEVVAFPTGLLQAGAAGVVAAQWAVDDAAAAMVVADFYRRWRLDLADPAAALRQAQRWVRDSTNGEKASMYATAHLDAPVRWLTPTAAAALHSEVAWADPDARDHASIDLWAGFAHYGV